jgi:hypothetical protein
VHLTSLSGKTGGGDRTTQRFALPSGHVEYVTGQQAQHTQQLLVEQPETQRPPGGFPTRRAEFGQPIVGALRPVLNEHRTHRLGQLSVGDAPVPLLPGARTVDDRLELAKGHRSRTLQKPSYAVPDRGKHHRRTVPTPAACRSGQTTCQRTRVGPRRPPWNLLAVDASDPGAWRPWGSH